MMSAGRGNISERRQIVSHYIGFGRAGLFQFGLSAPLEFVRLIVLTKKGESHANDASIGVWYRSSGLKFAEK